jgi:hypothetical protein
MPIQRPGDSFVTAWLRASTPEQMRMLDRLGARLHRKLDAADAKGSNEAPDRDWTRAYEAYQRGYQHFVTVELERLKLALMERRLNPGESPLTDEEYQAGSRELGLEALRTLPVDQLAPELERRGIKLIVAPEHEEKDR